MDLRERYARWTDENPSVKKTYTQWLEAELLSANCADNTAQVKDAVIDRLWGLDVSVDDEGYLTVSGDGDTPHTLNDSLVIDLGIIPTHFDGCEWRLGDLLEFGYGMGKELHKVDFKTVNSITWTIGDTYLHEQFLVDTLGVHPSKIENIYYTLKDGGDE